MFWCQNDRTEILGISNFYIKASFHTRMYGNVKTKSKTNKNCHLVTQII